MLTLPECAALVLLGGTLAVALFHGGRIVSRALEVSRVRSERRLESARALYGTEIARAHDGLRGIEAVLQDFVRSAGRTDTASDETAKAIERVHGLRESMASTRISRSAYEGGRVPVVGGNAAAISQRLGAPLKPYSWSPLSLLPSRLRGAGTQASMVIDEVRVLHNVDIERSVLLLTLVARAILVTLAPLLGGWTAANAPLSGTGILANLLWGAATVVSLATLAFAPRVVDLVMTDCAKARRFRRGLLQVELPLALGILVLLPAWTVVVFAAGWTNWWQRQTSGLAFDWRKLAVFVVAVVGLQALGLGIQSVGVEQGALEVAAALAVIAVTGSSYGAMLPLAAATAVAVVVGDSARSLRSARAARNELLSCSRQLATTAAAIDAAAPEMPLARNAATLARQGSKKLAREADLFGRRGVLARQVLAELFDQAISQSNLPRLDSSRYELAAAAAREAGRRRPAYVVEPILGELALARVGRRRHAQALQQFVVTALNEASVHGTHGVRVLARRQGDILLVTVGNLPRNDAAGQQSEGSTSLARFASRLPGGRLSRPPGLRPAEEVEFSVPGLWWVVELECEGSVLAPVLK